MKELSQPTNGPLCHQACILQSYADPWNTKWNNNREQNRIQFKYKHIAVVKTCHIHYVLHNSANWKQAPGNGTWVCPEWAVILHAWRRWPAVRRWYIYGRCRCCARCISISSVGGYLEIANAWVLVWTFFWAASRCSVKLKRAWLKNKQTKKTPQGVRNQVLNNGMVTSGGGGGGGGSAVVRNRAEM